MKKLVKYLEFLKEHKRINEGGGAGINFECDMSAYGEYKITKGNIEVISTKADAGETFDASGYQDGMDNVITSKVLDVDDSGLKNPSRSNLVDLRLSFNYNGEICEFLHDLHIKPIEAEDDFIFDSDVEAEQFLATKLSSKVEDLTFEDIFELKPDAEFIMDIEITGKYKEMHFGGWVRGTFTEGQSIMSDTDNFDFEVRVNDKYSVWIKDYSDLGSFVPELKAKKEFLTFYKDVFEMDSDDIKLYAIQGKDYAVIVDGKIEKLVDDEEEGQEFIDENGYDDEDFETKIIPTSEITDADEYEYELTDSDYEWYYDDVKSVWQQDI